VSFGPRSSGTALRVIGATHLGQLKVAMHVQAGALCIQAECYAKGDFGSGENNNAALLKGHCDPVEGATHWANKHQKTSYQPKITSKFPSFPSNK